MTTAEWALILTAAGGTLTWASYVARLLWTFCGHWDNTNDQLRSMAEQIGQLAARDNKIERRLERHLDWHDKCRAVLRGFT